MATDDGSEWGGGGSWDDIVKYHIEDDESEDELEAEKAAESDTAKKGTEETDPAPLRIDDDLEEEKPAPVVQSEEARRWALFNQEYYGNQNSSAVPPYPSELNNFGRDNNNGLFSDTKKSSDKVEIDPFDNPAALRLMTINIMHPLNVNDAARLFNNPFSQNHHQGRLPQLPDQPLTNAERRKMKESRSERGRGITFSGADYVRRLFETARFFEKQEARQRSQRRKDAPLALKSAGHRSRATEEREEFMEPIAAVDFHEDQRMDIDESSIPQPPQQKAPSNALSSFKRSLQQEVFAIHRLGDPSGEVEFHSFGRKAKTVEVPVTDEATEPIKFDSDEELEEESSTSSQKRPSVESRSVMFPPFNNRQVANLWTAPSRYELGTIPLPCCCEAETIPYSVLNVSPAKRCQAKFRDREARLIECRERCDPSHSSGLNWLPQCEKVIALCPNHAEIVRKHQVCPFCNEFCSEESKGEFVVCTGREGAESHLYHLDCRKKMLIEKCCPHCLVDKIHTLERPFPIVQKSCRKPANPFDGGYSGLLDDLKPRMCHFPPEWELEPVVGFFAHGEYPVFLNAMEEAQRRYSNDANEAMLWCLQKLLPATRGSFTTIETINESGETFLHKAVEAGSTGAVLLLCQLPIDTSAHDSSGQTALIKAVVSGDAGVIHAMVRSGCDPNLPDMDGRTPLHHAAYHKNFKAMHFFLENGANGNLKDVDGYAVIFSALEWVSAAQLLDLMILSVNVEVVDREKGWSPLHWIAFLGRNDLLPIFFDLDHYFAWADDDGNTPAHIAVIYQNREFFEVLQSCRKPPILLAAENRDGDNILSLAEIMYESHSEMFATVARYCRVAPGKSWNLVKSGTLGIISRDISQGKSDAPIPAVNYTNAQPFPGELTYSDITVKAPIYQMYKKTWEPRPCLKASLKNQRRNCDFHDCFTSGCPCISYYQRKNQVPLFATVCDLCSGRCRPQELDCQKIYKVQYHNCPVAGYGFLVFEGGATMARHKPALTEGAARTLMKYLDENSMDHPEAADELLFLRDLVEVSPYLRTSRRPRRSRSARRPRRAAAVPEQRSKSEPRGRAKNIRPLSECKIILEDDYDESTTVHALPELHQPESRLLYEYFSNPIDLFSELEEYRVDEILRGSVLRFDRLYPHIRWDLSERVLDREHEDPIVTVPPADDLPDADLHCLELMHECSALCECGPHCQNHITGRLPVARMAMYNFGQPVGWGVIALNRIIAGTIIHEYTGELYNAGPSLSLYYDDSYLFELCVQGSTALVDATRVGNVTRFINHSCKANVHAQEVRQHGSWPRIVLFATRTIYPTEQLTLDYGENWWGVKQDSDTPIYCCCGEKNCKYSKKAVKQRATKSARSRGRGRRQ